MADVLTPEQRRFNMQRIRSKDTKIEVEVRKYLFHKGFRYRKNVKKLPGTPDVVLSKYKTVIFINGCFWHHHENCKKAYIPKTNSAKWIHKFSVNQVNDKFQRDKLQELGWHVITIWECELDKDFEGIMEKVVQIIEKHQ